MTGVERVDALPDGRTLRLIVQGDIDAVLKTAARYHVTTFVSHEPSLEDVFLRFYQDDGGAAREDVAGGRNVFLNAGLSHPDLRSGWSRARSHHRSSLYPLAVQVAREELLALTRNPVVRVLAEPIDVLSPGGYATWRLSRLLPMLAIWALLAVSRTTRGEEESGAFDLLLSVSGLRRRIVVEKLAAITAALVLIGGLLAALALAGARATHVDLEPHRAVPFGLNATRESSRSSSARSRLSSPSSRRTSGRRHDRHPVGGVVRPHAA